MPRAARTRLAPGAPEPDLSIDPALTAEILAGFVRDEVDRTGRRAVVVGLSGGLDSTVCAYLAVRALGRENVHAILMPHRSSSPGASRDAESVVGALGIVAERVDITPLVDGFLQVTGDVGRIRLGNVMARARMIVLYDRSEVHRALVLGTGNKTEILLGYSTLHGDAASALNPVGDLYKTQVRALGRWLRVPGAILRKPPSADLWPGQSDEGEMGLSYDDVDRLLALRVDARVSPDTAVTMGFSRAFVDRVDGMVMRSQFKRKPPVVAKVSTRSVGWDFRYPRDWKT